MPDPMIYPVVLSGGSGTRLWPLSRELLPKQLMPLISPMSLLQMAVQRTARHEQFAAPLLVCNHQHRFLVAEQLRAIGVTAQGIMLEPAGRNTAPAAAAAARFLMRSDPEALLLVMPSDHVIADTQAFLHAVSTASAAARAGRLVTFGVAPQRPESGYGYIRKGDPLDGVPGCFSVRRFVEKPDHQTAQSLLAEGGWSWNSGIFLFHGRTFLQELERYEPGVDSAVKAAVDESSSDDDFIRLDANAFAACPSKSIDYAVMERTDLAAVVPAGFDWCDIGTLAALWELADKDENGNASHGAAVFEDCTDCFVQSDDRLIALLGLDNVIVVDTDDAVLVVNKDQVQDVSRIVERLKASGSEQYHAHSKVYRPWGWYKSIGRGDNFQVKEIQVKPGGKLSLQRHQHRAEHWVVVAGKGRVTRDSNVYDLVVNEATFIPLHAVHRLENEEIEPLTIVEVQCGDYLGEDDIERIEDIYGRKDG